MDSIRRSARPSLAERLRAASRVLQRIIGAPDYDAYLAHLRCEHPDRPPLSRAEFFNERLQERYARPGARCC